MTESMRQAETSSTTNAKDAAPTNPPSYEDATGGYVPLNRKPDQAASAAPKPGPSAPYVPPPGPVPRPIGTNVYYYQHPVTGHVITTHLPPDHPEMICLQAGEHVRGTHFGFLGILAAVVWFPLGIALCLLDRRIVCKRCGRIIDDGISC